MLRPLLRRVAESVREPLKVNKNWRDMGKAAPDGYRHDSTTLSKSSSARLGKTAFLCEALILRVNLAPCRKHVAHAPRKARSAAAISSRSSPRGNRWPYTSSVIAIFECPRRS